VNALAEYNEIRTAAVAQERDVVRERRAERSAPRSADYPWARLRARLGQALAQRSGRENLAFDIDLLDRAKFGADVAVRVTGLLAEHGAKAYITEHTPWIAEAFGSAELADAVARVDRKGIYVNLRLTDRWFLDAVQTIIDDGERFGLGDGRADRTQIVDYSSPNVAKVLHAGHFRSTILGHVLSNLYEACGATVYRVSHINDFGGFGFMLEGFRRFAPHFPPEFDDERRLLEIYTIRRALERAVAAGSDLDGAGADAEVIARYFPGAQAATELRAAWDEFVAASDRRFRALEDGDRDEVSLWQQMVDWSLNGFQSFYDALRIHIDFTIGESFYIQAGDAVIDAALQEGTAYRLTPERVAEETATLNAAVADGAITEAVRDKAVEGLGKDLGAIVIGLPSGERLVVRRSDGQSIYATRDIGAIKLRNELFAPTDSTYVTGQEQRVHFSRLFEAARVLGLVVDDRPRLAHVNFGFYVDEATGKKLSSRDSVTGVTELLGAAVQHFRARSAQDTTMTESELDEAAQQLAVGSVVFNDLKRDMKGTVPIARGDLGPVLLEFEKSGGAYVVYSACRARAILRRYGKPVPRAADIEAVELLDQEALLISKLLQLPEKVAAAADENNPAVLVRHLLECAGTYHSYYASARVLDDGVANEPRLLITQAVWLALSNGLRVCHIECPPKI
jgi:arginyl-tRNA synthetase